MRFIKITGAREHNLKNINLTLPRDKFIVITGLSGSGKSSLAFDTIYAEGQRRYVESLSTYARQFIGIMEKPDVDLIEGLSPAISIEQKTTSKNPRSTVGTITEIYDYLRLLYARTGTPYCYKCGREIKRQSATQIIDAVFKLPENSLIMILSPVVRGKKGEHRKIIEKLLKDGFVKVRIDQEIKRIDEEPVQLDKNKPHTIEVVIDRIKLKHADNTRKRLADSIETGLRYGDGLIIIESDGKSEVYSEKLACTECGISIEEMSPRMFSFNSPYGACPSCTGLGTKLEVDTTKFLRDPRRTIANGALIDTMGIDSFVRYYVYSLSRIIGFSLDIPFMHLQEDIKKLIFYGCNKGPIRINRGKEITEYYIPFDYEGLVGLIERRYRYSESEYARDRYLETFMRVKLCKECAGKRLRKESLAVKLNNKSIIDISDMTVIELKEFFGTIEFDNSKKIIAKPILKEINERLQFLMNVGLDYLTLSRTASTLSGGESQRIRLATQIGSALMGVLYILDEPTIGLHPRDTKKLLDTLMRLRDLGNTLIIIEHDKDTIEAADFVVDLGPGAGISGGEVVYAGNVSALKTCEKSLTGQYLSGIKKIEVPEIRRKFQGMTVNLYGARTNNLKNITVEFPLGLFICITGVSGSGKSSLINDTLYPALINKLNGNKQKSELYDDVTGIEYIDKIINIDQSPIGRTPRSNPATYTKVFNYIRELFSRLPDSRARGYQPGRFSFNVKGGRCEACAGDGIIKIEMHFLPDVYIPCEVCRSKRYNLETLEIRYRDKNIYDILQMTVDEALEFFKNIPQIKNKMKTLSEVGLGYITLGHPAPALSGGEAQRVKLAAELSKRPTGKTIYLLDEPTTGLHFDDVKNLLRVLHKLVDYGSTVIVIEHNLEVIKTADWLIDLGPGGGVNGGRVIAAGPPEIVACNLASETGKFLKKSLV
ncbi:MAG: excinuclease ABC subunit UvrA [Candidatus Hydrogenedentota bacterium]